MRRKTVVAAVLLTVCLGSIAQGIGFQTMLVGDPGNAGELSGTGPGAIERVCGAVGYPYRIGRYEVTNGQYTAFLNATSATDTYGLYNSGMAGRCGITRSGISGSYAYSVASDFINRPVSYVSHWDAVRFANWLQNGQPMGLQIASSTEDGSYFINGYNGQDGHTIQRKPGAKFFVPSEDEWYKAAYYKGGTSNAYWDYPTQSDSTPSNDLQNPDPGNNANFYQSGYTIGNPYYLTNVGEFENSQSHYNTHDQGGNVEEWTESIIHQGVGYAMRSVRGGSYMDQVGPLQASYGYGLRAPTDEWGDLGFRVAYIPEGWQPVPEPSSLMALAGGLGVILGLSRRKAQP